MDGREFRNTLGQFATGVTVVTTTMGEELIGLTANAFSSLSLDPPLILVCIDKRSSSMVAFTKERPFAINILQEGQEDECWKFASKSADRFEGVTYSLSNDGVPIISQNLATIECMVEDVLEGGDHYIVTGRVKKVDYDQEKQPLLFFRGKIGQLSSTEVKGR
ncbi:flavin reductase family protein [Alkalihalobacillus sp. MEB130]|uniref:flavin reductase family protein n=1 Tax=Alkalihalobacillus sp. MEB130 TaxID=2976704 RepID=UPI0028DE46CA|nr:flavin reductase family protein [Alkalihalobacillus sp. MEB130]MDT8860715.1 flavin reductase family protein [Alkalihalobacillus sp. MEB130]